MDPDEIARRVRRMCEEGRLPASEDRVHITGGTGTGAPCHVCGEPIDAGATDMELRATVRGVERAYRLHPRCFLAWRRHCGAKG
jgi:hypothetical protein